ncbi:cysteine--tRNA ligase [Desulfotalea psychrophila]|uniref:Cysteine--tRNA ligase n=1 Tax=Desulfotalea psychrophila (strain LSv54 / DSM 12343) TaxID=177439 RepID=SYC_DESPS|nr:cysteine--tRNA ligase [Desulfotalea psychrophila]Q6AJ23.1 RecName: Full=Cysteine--tRNA ligase; AltName: Full=Cysteinyl-tRNA synthetase; Short=CysRS [Desulfotalea psychrophila LSv54]CAG37657.1 probable cysteinyl-tRNA synthetase [Desulfotalea psychrophila LSv54]
MDIRVYNTLSGKKEPLQPIEPNHVKLYVCGITSYDYCHIGHARSALAFDMIVRYLRYLDYKVTFVRNFTDIDDKIIARANETGVTAQALAERFIDEFHTDMDNLGTLRPDIEPKATEHIQEMIDIIQELVDKDMAYPSAGDVYYVVNSFPEYGKLSGRNIEDMQAGARISINEQKRNPMDFALWKASKPGEPSWESPWGPGRPGWHIECSAMSRKYLGENFDIHGGGKDLIFPHHENEIAQSEGANGKPFANTWIHHGFVTIKDEKMSKSLGNFLTIKDILDHYHPEILRAFIFSTQYRNPLDFSEIAMQDAETALVRLYECLHDIQQLAKGDPTLPALISAKDAAKLNSIETRFQEAMNNDFNTALALGVLYDAIKIINRAQRALTDTPSALDVKMLKGSMTLIQKLAGIVGLLQEDANLFLQQRKEKMLSGIDITEAEIESYIQQRLDARANKDWARSDEIRDILLEKGITLKDGADGTGWSVHRAN